MEKVVCAANWYEQYPLVVDKAPVGFARPINCATGMVFCGLRHHNCLHQMVSLSGKSQHEMGHETQGFLTTFNRFVGRKEAMKIALETGQVEFENLGNPKVGLFSEDLY